MNTLRSVRDEVALQLAAAGVTVHEFIPSRVNPPAAVLEAGSPYMTQGQSFSDFVVRINVVLLAGNATNEIATDELDQLICAAIDNLETFDIESVEQPEALEINGAQYLGVRIRLLTNKEIQT